MSNVQFQISKEVDQGGTLLQSPSSPKFARYWLGIAHAKSENVKKKVKSRRFSS